MDALSHLLYDVRSAGALFGRTIMSSPWSVRFLGRTRLTLVSMLTGEGWVVPDGLEPVRLRPRDIAVAVGPAPFTVTDHPDHVGAVSYIHRGPDRCTSADGTEVSALVRLGVRTCGDRLDAPHALLTGAYPVHGRVSERLLTTLPRVLVVPDRQRPSPILDLAVAEIERDDPGQQAVLDRLLDLLLLATLREWFARPESDPPTWYVASSDPVVGPALRMMHSEPQRPWTLAALAELGSVSRATFARRFADLLGEPPMTYLTGWRLATATDLLERTDLTVDAVARQVGYANGYALSVAFKRQYGTRPSELRIPATVTV